MKGGDNSGMDLHPVHGLVIILPVASCEETKINLKAQALDGPLFKSRWDLTTYHLLVQMI